MRRGKISDDRIELHQAPVARRPVIELLEVILWLPRKLWSRRVAKSSHCSGAGGWGHWNWHAQGRKLLKTQATKCGGRRLTCKWKMVSDSCHFLCKMVFRCFQLHILSVRQLSGLLCLFCCLVKCSKVQWQPPGPERLREPLHHSTERYHVRCEWNHPKSLRRQRTLFFFPDRFFWGGWDQRLVGWSFINWTWTWQWS